MIKDLVPRQTVCIAKNNKGKPCHGSLKRYHPFATYYNESNHQLKEIIKNEFGENPNLVLLKCETCQTIYYLPEELKTKFQQSD